MQIYEVIVLQCFCFMQLVVLHLSGNVNWFSILRK